MASMAEVLASRLKDGRVLVAKQQHEPRVEGLRGGHKLQIGYWKHSDSSGWYVRAGGAKVPLLLHVAPHRLGDAAVIERGAMVDLVLGDAEFDQGWCVEGAPADTAKRVLDADVRALLAPMNAALMVNEEKIVVNPPTSATVTPSIEELDAAATVVAAVAQRVAQAAGELAPNDSSRPERAEEVARLQATRALLWARARWWERALMVFGATILTAALCAFAYGMLKDVVEELTR